MKQLLIFGDSIMRGVYYSAEHGRHKLYRERFASLRDKGYEIKNCSVMGATISTGTDLVRRRLTNPAEDTTVIFEYGGNDCDFHWSEISDNPTGSFSPNTAEDISTSVIPPRISPSNMTGSPSWAAICISIIPVLPREFMKLLSTAMAEHPVVRNISR